jgi:mRNA interferase RelE/StbE
LAWRVEYARSVQKNLSKLDRQVARRIVEFMEYRVASLTDPRSLGSSLMGPLSKFWRYRVGDYRILCELKDDLLIVLVVEVDHRKDVYR